MTSNQPPGSCNNPGDEQNGGGQTKNSSSDLISQIKNVSQEDNSSLPASQQNTPTKSQHGQESNSPTKTRGSNRRKNEARRRSNSHKKSLSARNESSETKSQIPRPTLATQDNSPNDCETHPPEGQAVAPTDDDTTQAPIAQQKKHFSGNYDKRVIEVAPDRSNLDGTNLRHHDETKELKDQIRFQMHQTQSLVEQVKMQLNKIKELEAALSSTTRTCKHYETLLQQELSSKASLESENDGLNQKIARLKKQLSTHEKNKFVNDELMRVLNATLMERETEVSILKLKLTRLQTNPSTTMMSNLTSSVSSVRQEPNQMQKFANSGRSNSEFNRNSYIRSSMMAEAASARASTSQLRCNERDAPIWALVPEELTPSRRPQLLEKTYPSINSSNQLESLDESFASSYASRPFERDRLYKTLPKSMKSPSQEFSVLVQDTVGQRDEPPIEDAAIDGSKLISNQTSSETLEAKKIVNKEGPHIAMTDDSIRVISTQESQRSTNAPIQHNESSFKNGFKNELDENEYSTVANSESIIDNPDQPHHITDEPTSLTPKLPTTPAKISGKVKKLFDKFKRSETSSRTDLNESVESPVLSPFRRGANRATMVGAPNDIRAQISPIRQAAVFQTDKPFAEWDTDMIVDWLTMIGLSMYTSQCRRWVRCGAHIMNATPAEVDKGLGITNHLHRKKLRLAISELNGDCDKVTKAAAKLDYLWVARWLDDIGLPQYKEAFINARVDGRVLNYLTVEDLISMNVKGVLHHASIRCGISILRSIQFDLQVLKRRATADEIEQMNIIHQQISLQVANGPENSDTNSDVGLYRHNDVGFWTCHRVMEWLRMIDFAEFAPNLRGSGVHGGLILYEDAFNIDTMCSLLSIPQGSTLLRRHLSTFFRNLIGGQIDQRKRQLQISSPKQQLNPLAEIKIPKKSQWFGKIKSSKVNQESLDEYLCPMYPIEPPLLKIHQRKKSSVNEREEFRLSKIPESVNV